MLTQDDNEKRMLFRDLADAVVRAWDRSGFPWQDLVDGFGGGDGTGLPGEGVFRDLAVAVVEARLRGLPGAELRRLMRSRLYGKHLDVDRHCDFTAGEGDADRSELIGLAVWDYLFFQMERQYEEPSDEDAGDDDVDGQEADTGGEPLQLTLPGEWPKPGISPEPPETHSPPAVGRAAVAFPPPERSPGYYYPAILSDGGGGDALTATAPDPAVPEEDDGYVPSRVKEAFAFAALCHGALWREGEAQPAPLLWDAPALARAKGDQWSP